MYWHFYKYRIVFAKLCKTKKIQPEYNIIFLTYCPTNKCKKNKCQFDAKLVSIAYRKKNIFQ